ncbi:MAG: TrkA C-terminal domain-containing protein, partial [Bdellovibrionota bacterium]
VITVVTIFGKFFSTATGALLAGRGMRHSVQAGFSLAQIGEFSFIIASLGQTLKVTSDFLYPIAISVSAITTFSTPYLIRSADPAVHWLEKNLPARLLAALSRYGSSASNVSNTTEWATLVRSYLMRLVVNGTLIVAVFLLVIAFLPAAPLVQLLTAVALSAPFAWAFAISKPNREVFRSLWMQGKSKAALTSLEVSRIVLLAILYGAVSSRIISWKASVLISVVALGILYFVFARQLRLLYGWIENRFMQNLGEREERDKSTLPPLAPWDAHITEFEVSPSAESVGKSLIELQIRERFGVTVAMIERGNRRITAPQRDERILPFDRLAVIGTDEQLAKFSAIIEAKAVNQVNELDGEFVLQPVTVTGVSKFIDKSIRESGLRELAQGLVVGVERDGARMLNPDSGLAIKGGDRLWIVGDRRALKSLRESVDID